MFRGHQVQPVCLWQLGGGLVDISVKFHEDWTNMDQMGSFLLRHVMNLDCCQIYILRHVLPVGRKMVPFTYYWEDSEAIFGAYYQNQYL